MIYSMTGYGRGEYNDGSGINRVEIRSYNHRYLDMQIRLPKELNSLEDAIRNHIRSVLGRGRIEVFISREDLTNQTRNVKLDEGLLAGYHQALDKLKSVLNEDKPLQVRDFLDFPDLFVIQDTVLDKDALWPGLEKALQECIFHLLAMRSKEGTQLRNDMMSKISVVSQIHQDISQLAHKVPQDHGQRLKLRLEELLPDGVPLDQDRLATEIAIFAERCDIAEELVRFQSHLTQFREQMMKGGPIGRKLDFLLQELHREINTMGVKANNAHIAGLVVEVKSLLEKIREQVQNIE